MSEPPPAALPEATGIVCLDPGHASTPYEIDPETGLNTSDWANEPEITIVWDIACRTAALLEGSGVQVVLTKSGAYDPVNLKQRALIANRSGAAMIVHIHTDPGISSATTFYPGAAPYDWKANSDSGRTAHIAPGVQQASASAAAAFHQGMSSSLAAAGIAAGGLRMENRGSTGTGNYGPLLSYDVWSAVPTFTLENNQAFADAHREAVARAIAAGILAAL
ncbi:MAG: N-acetylmuramoyl-L-alanine amidase family protein [Candidatus Geothermincolia bacterium]